MPNFTYSARDNNGKVIEGKLEARDAQAVAEILQDRGLIVVNIKEKEFRFRRAISNKYWWSANEGQSCLYETACNYGKCRSSTYKRITDNGTANY